MSNKIAATSNENITEDEGRSLAFMHWGQWVDHDLDLAPMTETNIHNKEGECDTSCHYAPPCFPIKVMEHLALEMSREKAGMLQSVCGGSFWRVPIGWHL